MSHFSYDFLFFPAIKLFGAAVPKVNCTVNGSSDDAVVPEV